MTTPQNSGSNSKKGEIAEIVRRLKIDVADNVETKSAQLQRDLIKLKELMETVFSELNEARSEVERLKKQVDKDYKGSESTGNQEQAVYHRWHLAVVSPLGDMVLAAPEDQWRSRNPLLDAMQNLGTQVGYHLFDLEATIRERDSLRELASRTNG